MAKKHYSQISGWQLGKCAEMGDRYRIPIYSFSGGTEVSTMIKVKDMAKKVREFKITLNDEKGVTGCREV